MPKEEMTFAELKRYVEEPSVSDELKSLIRVPKVVFMVTLPIASLLGILFSSLNDFYLPGSEIEYVAIAIVVINLSALIRCLFLAYSTQLSCVVCHEKMERYCYYDEDKSNDMAGVVSVCRPCKLKFTLQKPSQSS